MIRRTFLQTLGGLALGLLPGWMRPRDGEIFLRYFSQGDGTNIVGIVEPEKRMPPTKKVEKAWLWNGPIPGIGNWTLIDVRRLKIGDHFKWEKGCTILQALADPRWNETCRCYYVEAKRLPDAFTFKCKTIQVKSYSLGCAHEIQFG